MESKTFNGEPLIEFNELLVLCKDETLVLVDASNGKDQKKSLKGALSVDLNEDLSSVKQDFADGGRHPLPSVEEFLATLSGLGIGKDSHVVVFDHKSGANAATRFWWMLKALGHQNVQVLNGRLSETEQQLIEANRVFSKQTKPTPHNATDWKLPMAEMAEVQQHSDSKEHLIIDVRAPERFIGAFEPIDLVAGHIPGAINLPFSSNLDESGRFFSKEKLKEKYDTVFKEIGPENTVVHCGSGVTACHTLFTLCYAGFEIPKLYVGSWSEWSRNNKKIVNE